MEVVVVHCSAKNAAVLCENCHESHAILNKQQHQQKKEEEQQQPFGCSAAFWFDTFATIFHASRSLVGHETLKDEWYITTKAYQFTIMKDFCIILYCVPMLSLHIVSRGSTILSLFLFNRIRSNATSHGKWSIAQSILP